MAAGPATAALRAQARPAIAQSGQASSAVAAPFLLIGGAQGPAPGLARRRGGSWRSWPKGAVCSPPDPSGRGAAAHCRVRPRRRQVAGGRGLESGRRPRARWFCCCCEEGPGPFKPENAGRKCVTGGSPGTRPSRSCRRTPPPAVACSRHLGPNFGCPGSHLDASSPPGQTIPSAPLLQKHLGLSTSTFCFDHTPKTWEVLLHR
ncbi:PREDICTED: uncharacterized protein LOC108635853 [Capra hircus]|uniref:uncharacterized protein LOC108635853 n=1 Tax=Capra hircus TaxID=9925 RepID=UPI00084737D6|nr:PREDICTED: uncharacterized protein LOC108635853 [Capra hircus]